MTRKMKTSKRRSKYDVETCRVCGIQALLSKNNALLEEPLYEGDEDSPLIFEALEEIMGEQIMKFKGYSNICFGCQKRLKIAFDLKRQYYESKQLLFNNFLELVDSCYYESQRVSIRNRVAGDREYKTEESSKEGGQVKNEPNVELILGKNSFDIKELVILEEPRKEKDHEIYQGFLNNLGTQVSATFMEEKNKLQIIKNIQPGFGMVKVEIKDEDDTANGDPSVESDDNVPLSKIKEKATNANTKALSCGYCNRSFKSADFLKTHQVVCEKFKKLECYICQEKKINSTMLLRHLANVHGLGKNHMSRIRRVKRNPNRAKCQVCSKVFCSKSALNKHIRAQHRSEQHLCEFCGKIFTSTHVRNMHILEKHKRITKELCPICSQTFQYKRGLKEHMIRLHEKRTTKEMCPVCAKTFQYKRGLNEHMMRSHEKRTTKETCPVCARTYHYKGALDYHMQTHTKDYRYKCQYCENKFGTKDAKKRHERTHTGEKPFACSYDGCTIAFTTGYARTLHEQVVHRGTKAHKCDACSREFARKYKLMTHMLSHNGPFICKFCQLGCFNQNVLDYHLKYKHKIQIENEPVANEA